MKKRNEHFGDTPRNFDELVESHVELKESIDVRLDRFMDNMERLENNIEADRRANAERIAEEKLVNAERVAEEKLLNAEREAKWWRTNDELSKKIAELTKNIGGLGQSVGGLMENLIQGGAKKILTDVYGIDIFVQYENVEYQGPKGNYEADFVLHGQDSDHLVCTFLGEVKTKLKIEDLKRIQDRKHIFWEYVTKISVFKAPLNLHKLYIMVGFSKTENKDVSAYIVDNDLENKGFIFVKAGGDGSLRPYKFKK